ncbi:sensor histidine kinase [Geomobilimonas luticola]|uniref:histidine kinase n=1 Tax=Geomobilimonas luticola TaxID=1114878 RepID=A0ABS5SGC1_9BACT|nr:response regulator [Geomobilimonas luticola]MBT0654401.1 response regulator [Geomobilimonas luticola]
MGTTDSPGHDISLLYVEDEHDAREMLSRIIGHHYPDVRIFVAENGEEGLESFRRNRPEIVITDINMPITDGIRMATEIKSLVPSTEIIALTAYTNPQHLLQAIEIGISHYILKPIDIDQIFRVIDKALALIRSERAITRQNEVIRNLNEELVKKAAELERVNRELESFNYTVAHDLRSPMAAISGYSQVLLDLYASNLDSAGKDYLQVINREILRMSNLTGALLKFSVHSRKRVVKKWTDLSAMVTEITDNLRAREPGRRVDFRIATGIKGYGDPDLLRIVLENLLGNAWKYSVKKDDVRIEFGTINKEEDLVYFVRDNGHGFAPQDAEKLFVPFQRLQHDNEIEGLGIGLSTVYRIIQRHGGRAWAEGETGKGAVFFFTL